MRIAIATTGRFHVLDLARELAALGHEVAFHTLVPARRAARFGLPEGSHRGHLLPLLPLVVAQRWGRGRLRDTANRALHAAFDRRVARRFGPCDVFIGMSGLAVASARAARRRYGARVLIERGSRHILSQKAILDRIGGETVPEWAVVRELESYALADRIVVPSRHVVESFAEHGVPGERLFRNPYGVDLSMFRPTAAPSGPERTVLFVGTWSHQKGVDLLVEAVRDLPGARLVHVGATGDAAGVGDGVVEHVGAVPQWTLPERYAKAHLLVQPSRQEGLSLVQAQALACGLPVVCTDRTGGEDLAELLSDPGWVVVVPHDDVAALRRGIERGLELAARQSGLRQILTDEDRARLSWQAYGMRYSQFLETLVGGGR